MFGIGGGEIFLIIVVALMLFGSDKIPDIARMLGKGMAEIKNATNDIKSEIQKSAEINDIKDLNPMNQLDLTSDITKEIDKAKEDIEDMTGPIKRQM
ncbi:twin-arginine translocase TatA/TatE family subunit [Flavobacterium sp.]|uniref:twin-arginine translocase TatA/TatE family subunit n=1 Tax=Flavobacterium sp. TaxID=239 RepID=UPI0028BF1361|nr:twin-arginine translocase TatA/TatE family subunit [Flavobacterium sp.]